MKANFAAIRLVVAMIAIGCTVVARAESPGNSGAEASRREAKVYADWPFGTVEALRRQAETAAALGVPVEVTDSIGIKLRLIPAGEFMMGSPDNEEERRDDEGPAHRVRITKPFYLGVYEVTQEQYVQLTGNNPSKFAGKTNPVEVVNWKEATEFCAKLSAKEGVEYRLPTEAQWEWACRAGTATPFHFGYATNGSQANTNGKRPYDATPRPPYPEWKLGPSHGRTTVVGSYPPNAWGLHDMHGNVSEWCRDWYAPTTTRPRRQTIPLGRRQARAAHAAAAIGNSADTRPGRRTALTATRPRPRSAPPPWAFGSCAWRRAQIQASR